MRRRIRSLNTAHAQIAIRIGAMYSIRSAIPIGRRPIETK
jgi:hypothetical protein